MNKVISSVVATIMTLGVVTLSAPAAEATATSNQMQKATSVKVVLNNALGQITSGRYLDGKGFPISISKVKDKDGLRSYFDDSSITTGVIGTLITDLDMDRENELLVISIGAARSNRIGKTITATVYEAIENEAVKTATLVMSDNSFTNDAGETAVFSFQKDGQTHLGFHSVHINQNLMDSCVWDLSTHIYDGTNFIEKGNVSITGSSVEPEDLEQYANTIKDMGLNCPSIFSKILVTEQDENLKMLSSAKLVMTANEEDVKNYVWGNRKSQTGIIPFGEVTFKDHTRK